jgi:hypothetical protein
MICNINAEPKVPSTVEANPLSVEENCCLVVDCLEMQDDSLIVNRAMWDSKRSCKPHVRHIESHDT